MNNPNVFLFSIFGSILFVSILALMFRDWVAKRARQKQREENFATTRQGKLLEYVDAFFLGPWRLLSSERGPTLRTWCTVFFLVVVYLAPVYLLVKLVLWIADRW